MEGCKLVRIMRSLYQQKAVKEYECEKCGRSISKGKQYYKIKRRYAPPRFRCLNCKPRPSELHTGYVADLMHISEELDDWLLKAEDKEILLAPIKEYIGWLENMKDEMEEKASNIEEYFPNSELAQNLYERAEYVNEALDLMEELRDTLTEKEGELEESGREEVEAKIEEIKSALEEAQVR